MNKTYTLTFTERDLQLLISCIGKQPLEVVNTLYRSIENQVLAANNAPAEPECAPPS